MWKYMFLDSIWSFSRFRSMFLDQAIHFRETLEDQEKGRSPKKLKPLIEVANVVHIESTCSKLQHDPYLISVACSYT